jgi:hypothetical protein
MKKIYLLLVVFCVIAQFAIIGTAQADYFYYKPGFPIAAIRQSDTTFNSNPDLIN